MADQLGVILERIDELKADVSELKKELRCTQDAFTAFKMAEIEKLVTMDTSGTASAKARIADLEKRIQEIEKILPQLVMLSRSVTLIGGLLVASVFGLLWAVFTHQVTVIFP